MTNRSKVPSFTRSFAALTATTAAAFAIALLGARDSARAQGEPPRPPQIAYDACNGHSSGDACTVSFGGHEIRGVCMDSQQGLFCRPDHPPIPQAAISACDGHAEGAACTVDFGGHSIDGTCAYAPDHTLACRPNRLPPGP